MMFPLLKFIIWGKETNISVKVYERAQELILIDDLLYNECWDIHTQLLILIATI